MRPLRPPFRRDLCGPASVFRCAGAKTECRAYAFTRGGVRGTASSPAIAFPRQVRPVAEGDSFRIDFTRCETSASNPRSGNGGPISRPVAAIQARAPEEQSGTGSAAPRFSAHASASTQAAHVSRGGSLVQCSCCPSNAQVFRRCPRCAGRFAWSLRFLCGLSTDRRSNQLRAAGARDVCGGPRADPALL